MDKITRAYKDVFNTESGTLVLHDLMERCFFFNPTYQSGDSHQMAFNEGARSTLLLILEKLALTSDSALLMNETRIATVNNYLGDDYAG